MSHRINHSQQAKSATALVIGQFFASLAEAVVPIIVLRTLPMAEVGILSALLFLYNLLAPILAAALPQALMYYLPGRPATDRRAIASKVGLLLLTLGILACLLFAVLGLVAVFFPQVLARLTDSLVGGVSVFGPSGLQYLLVLALLPLGDLPVRMLPNLLVVEGRARSAALLSGGKSLFTVLSVTLPVLLSGELWVIVTSYSLAGLLSGILVPLTIEWLYHGQGRQTKSPVTVRQLLGYALPMSLNEIVMRLYNRLDFLLISAFFPAGVVALYSAGAWQVPVLGTIAYSVGAVYAPQLRLLFAEGRHQEAIAAWRTSAGKVALIVVPCSLVTMVAAEEIIVLLFGISYLPAAQVFRIYSLLTLGRVVAFGVVLITVGRPASIVLVAVISLVANLVVSVPLIFWLGMEGAALGTVVAFLVHVAAFCWAIARATSLPWSQVLPWRDYLPVVLLGSLAMLPAIAWKLYFAPSPGMGLLLVTLLTLATFTVLARLTGLFTADDLLYFRWLMGNKKR